MTSNASSQFGTRLVTLLLTIEAISTFTLWTLNPANSLTDDLFTLFLAISIVSLAMISSIYRAHKRGNQSDKISLSVGCGLILVLIYVCMAL